MPQRLLKFSSRIRASVIIWILILFIVIWTQYSYLFWTYEAIPPSNQHTDRDVHYDLIDAGNDSIATYNGCLFYEQRKSLAMYLLALQHSVRIVALPPSLSFDVVARCTSLTPEKRLVSSHPHSIELHFPRTLKTMETSAKLENILISGDKDHVLAKSAQTDVIYQSVIKDENHKSVQFSFSPLWQKTDSLKSFNGNLSEPLFYYVEAYPYHVIYCTRKKNNKEDWTLRDSYWREIADYILNESEQSKNNLYHPYSDFLQNMGQDFLLPASHPQSGPSRIHPASLSYLQRATFLRTDFDISGSVPKDIIVPYYTVDHSIPHSTEDLSFCNAAITSLSSVTFASNRTGLMFFSGSDNPKNGYRRLLLRALIAHQQQEQEQEHALNSSLKLQSPERSASGGGSGFGGGDGTIEIEGVRFIKRAKSSHSSAPMNGSFSPTAKTENTVADDEIFFSLSSMSLRPIQYQQRLLMSKYCLILRGDTTSSKRLFSAIFTGCVPVIISDGLKLPFSSIIDYSTFTITFPESIVHDVASLFVYLREVPSTRYLAMRCALSDARKYLIFGHTYVNQDVLTVLSPLNPVTLTLVEALIRRETACIKMEARTSSTSTMCRRLKSRLDYARGQLGVGQFL